MYLFQKQTNKQVLNTIRLGLFYSLEKKKIYCSKATSTIIIMEDDDDNVPDNTVMLHSKFYSRKDHEYPHPFDHAIEKMTAWDKITFPGFTSGLMKMEKRESIKDSKGEVVAQKLVYKCITAACFLTKKQKEAANLAKLAAGSEEDDEEEECTFCIRLYKRAEEEFCTIVAFNSVHSKPHNEQRKNNYKMSSVVGNSDYLTNTVLVGRNVTKVLV